MAIGQNKMVGDKADAERMDFLQREILRALLPYRENTEAILVVGALMRVARTLLRLYKEELRKGFIEATCAYLRGQDTLPDDGRNMRDEMRKLGFFVPSGSKN